MQNETRSCPLAKEHAEIWLSPPCDSESNDGRLWAPDNPFDPCPECGAEAVRFVRADLAVSDKPCDPADPCPTAYDLASERDTLDGLLSETKDRLDAALAQVARLREAMAAIVARSENGELGTSRTRDMAGLARAALAETSEREIEALSSVIDAVLQDAMASGIGIARIAPDEFFARGDRPCTCHPSERPAKCQKKYALSDCLAALAETADTPAPAPAPADDGWIAWEGGECPVGPLVRVDVRFANGTSLEGEHAQTFDWDADDDEAIVAYRIVEARDE